jgi:hypothetical protein
LEDLEFDGVIISRRPIRNRIGDMDWLNVAQAREEWPRQ